jgi:hypothetical protein
VNKRTTIDDVNRKKDEFPETRVRIPRGADSTLFGGWGIKL